MKKSFWGFSNNVFNLSVLALLNDIVGETVRRLFPLFLANILGVRTTIIGLVEGIGEATPHIVEPISGYLSDRWGRRRIFVIFGQILRSSMLLLIFVTSWPQALLVRFLDRTGKGLAIAPRDALLSQSSQKQQQGKSFGFNRAMDNLGATIGIVAIIIILLSKGSFTQLDGNLFKFIILVTGIPSLLGALFILLFFVSDKKNSEKFYEFRDHFNKDFYVFLAISFIFSLGSFSDGFLVLKASEAGIPLLQIFLLLFVFTLASTVTATPAGSYSDHHGRRKFLAYGFLVFAASFIGFSEAQNFFPLAVLFVVYGVYYGITQGVAKAIISDLVVPSRRGLAFGLYNMVVGLALLPSSIIAGFLWQYFGSAVAFYFGAFLGLIAAFLLLHVLPRYHQV